ncbi:hypothetical protein XH91_31925 [Bradyrhizobium guangzhouense]|uniref:DUF6895 domain-containing protein n=1 Tax=Bradyrhizobium guangzhouense TaxID=1325095 RepID=A0AAE5X6B4_9BRAD|nr:hypothetical protein XH91_31925 [Bradyrhizobium guangzhouense]
MLGWIIARKDLFRLAISDDASRVRLVKPLGELTILAGTAKMLSKQTIIPNALSDQLLQFCWDELNGGDLLAELIRRYPSCLIFVSVYAVLFSNGFFCERLHAAILEKTSVRGYCEIELPAWQQLDVGVALDELGITSPWNVTELYERTWLGQRLEPWSAWPGAAYSVTHTVFSVTRMGRATDKLPEASQEYLRLWMPVWQVFYAQLQQFDLLSELVATAHCAGFQCDDVDFFEILKSHQCKDGHIPSPEGATRSVCIGETAPERIYFLEQYHTSIVALLAMLFELEHGAERPDK